LELITVHFFWVKPLRGSFFNCSAPPTPTHLPISKITSFLFFKVQIFVIFPKFFWSKIKNLKKLEKELCKQWFINLSQTILFVLQSAWYLILMLLVFNSLTTFCLYSVFILFKN
jgi:hypothetical protein